MSTVVSKLFSVGHSNRTFEGFVEILKAHNIEILVDVRGGRAQSRTFPHFNTENFAGELPKRNVEYLRIPELGGRRYKMKDANPTLNEEWRLDAFRYYADYAYYDPRFEQGIDLLVKLGSEANVAFMCSEAVPWRCHRSIITDWLIMTKDVQVDHLLSVTQTIVGKPHIHAQQYHNKVVYPKTKLLEFFDI